MHSSLQQPRLYFLLLVEACLAAACFSTAIWVFKQDEFALYLELEGGWQRLAAVVVTYLIVSYLFDFFRQIEAVSRLSVVLQLLQLIGGILLVQAVLGFVDSELNLPQPVAMLGSVLAALLIIPWRLFLRPALWNVFGARKVLLVGSSPGLMKLAWTFRRETILGSEVIGTVVAAPDDDAVAGPVLGQLADFDSVIAQSRPDQIIVSPKISNKKFLRSLMNLKSAGLTVRTVGQAWEALFGRVYSYDLDPYAVIYRHELDARPSSLALQSIYTNLLGLAAVVVSLPLMLLIALLLRLTRKGPVFSSLQCIGLHGIPFHMYRFRIASRTRTDWMSWLLIRLRLEGLPQVMNLVRGEMALIGPRAERTEFHDELAELLPFYRHRHHVKPGVFGWSQLHCDPLPEEDTLARIEYDLYYIKHISLIVDAQVVVRALRWLLSDPQSE